MIRAVFFDAVGTLLFPDPPAPAKYAEVGRRYGSRLPEAEVATRFRAAFAAQEEQDHRAGLATSEGRERERWRAIVAEVLGDAADPAACFAELWEWFGRPGAWRLAEGAGAVIGGLARRGLVLGLASNLDSRLRPVAAGLPALSPLTHLVISAEVGWRKPSPAFYARVVAGAGCQPDEVLYVGDDPANDREGATAAGLRALLVAGGPGHPRRLEDLLGLDLNRESERRLA